MAKESRLGDELRKGWCLGSPSFRERMLGLLEANGRVGSGCARALDASLRRNHGEEQAAKLLQRGLALCGLGQEDLARLKKNEARKVAIAAVIRRRTVVPNEWIARALQLGHVSRVSRCWSQENTLTAQLEKTLYEI